MNSSNIARHSSPCAATFASRSVVRNAASPSGKSVAVGRSVLRYSTPRRPSSSPSSAYAPDEVKSGCQLEKTSWRNPGTVSSVVWIAPPSHGLRSRMQTRQPARARSAPPTMELMPLPTNTASTISTSRESTGCDLDTPRADLIKLRRAPPRGRIRPPGDRRGGDPPARRRRGGAGSRRRPDPPERDEGARRVAGRARRPQPARGAAPHRPERRRRARARRDGDLHAADARSRRGGVEAGPRRGGGRDRGRPGAEPRHDRRQRLLERPDEPLPAARGGARRAR